MFLPAFIADCINVGGAPAIPNPVYGATPGVPANAAKFGLPKILPAGVPVNAGKFAFAKIFAGIALAAVDATTGAAAAATTGAATTGAAAPIKVPVAAPPASEARKLLVTIGAAVDIAPAKAGIAAAPIIIPLTNVI